MPRFAILLALFLAAPAGAGGYCENDVLVIDARFDGGRLDHCEFTSDSAIALTFRNEDYKVDSAFAWFAYRIVAHDAGTVEVRMHFPDSYARFWPKLSRDGKTWTRADEDDVIRSEVGKSMTLRIDVDETGTWVAAQELLTQDYYDDWLANIDAHPDVQTSVIGHSNDGRPITLASTADMPEAIVLLGRQHPVEVPGVLAMRGFVDVVLGDSPLAREFRQRFKLVIVPLLNPDGVASGNARHNEGLADLNRDWGPFTQPETQSVAALLDQLDESGIKPRLMLDFHATKMSPTMIFYTQVPDDHTDPELFATNWLSRADERIDGFEFTHSPQPPSGLDNTKNYFFSRYGIPAITYEIGDEFDRQAIRDTTSVFAEEMMRTMLEAP